MSKGDGDAASMLDSPKFESRTILLKELKQIPCSWGVIIVSNTLQMYPVNCAWIMQHCKYGNVNKLKAKFINFKQYSEVQNK